MKKLIKIQIIMVLALLWGCDQEEYDLDTAPTIEDAAFTSEVDAQGTNYIRFSNPTGAFLKVWDFGNGASMEGDEVIAYYPFEGEYEATLTVYTNGGSVQSSEVITITETDTEICNRELLQLLTGGCDQPEGKTWVIDSDRTGHFGVGPVGALTPEYYQAAPNEKAGGGMYDDEFTFVLNQFDFTQETNGNVYLNPAKDQTFLVPLNLK